MGERAETFAFAEVSGHCYSEQRWQGFSEYVEARGCRAELYFHESDRAKIPFKRFTSPVGIMAANDRIALSVIHFARLAGMHIPDNVAVIGVDNDVVQAEMLQTPLTSVQPNCRQIGWEALAALDSVFQSGHPLENKALIRIPPLHVVARASTDLLFIDDEEIRRALRYMRANFGRIKSISEIVSMLPLSRRTFEIRFHQAVGRSPHQELARLRWQHARNRLHNSKLTLLEIGEECGFQNLKDFSTFFTKHEGNSPGRFRRMAPAVD
ncbi:MAG: substrate-binding domain-containing protein [Verrucomicrobia bacterium]|nr:substrate-binding domain-containing protein [Verrucomicrobiota bacterium]